MAGPQDIMRLQQLENRVVQQAGDWGIADIRPMAKELGLDMLRIMGEVQRACLSGKYTVGNHVKCTRGVVLPSYWETGKLHMDRDHVEGLRQILAVSRGYRGDY